MQQPFISIQEVGEQQANLVALILEFPLRKYGKPAAMLLAVDNFTKRAVGAAAIWQLPQEARIWVRVVTGYQRKGIGSTLLSKVENLAKQMQNSALVPAMVFDDARQAFLINQGFNGVQLLTKYRLAFQNAKKRVFPVYYKVRKRGMIPLNAEIIDFKKANELGLAKDVAKLLSTNLEGRFENVLDRVKGKEEGFDLAASFAVLVGGKPIAVATSRYRDESKDWNFPSIVVSSDRRGGWANVWLRYHWCNFVEKNNITADLTFAVRETYKDTLKFAARTNAVVEGGIYAYSKKIG